MDHNKSEGNQIKTESQGNQTKTESGRFPCFTITSVIKRS